MDSTYRPSRGRAWEIAPSPPAVGFPQDVPEEVRPVGIRAVVRGVLRARPVPDGDPGDPPRRGASLRQGLKDLDARYPGLSRWVGGRLDIEVPAILVSVGVHAVLLLVLATAGYAVHTEARREFQSRVVDTAVPGDLTRSDFQDLDQSDEPPAMTPVAGSFSPNLSTMTLSAPPASAVATTGGSGPSPAPDLASLDVRRATELVGADGVDARPDRLDQGQRRRARRRRRGGRRPDRRRDPPPAGAGAARWSSGRSTPRGACRSSGERLAKHIDDGLHPHRRSSTSSAWRATAAC